MQGQDGKVLREWEETVNPKAFMWLPVQRNNHFLCSYVVGTYRNLSKRKKLCSVTRT